jgi:3-methyladenine DNA glycosylase Mpg
VKRFEALTEPTGETSLCNPSIFLAGAYTGCKNAACHACSENTKGSPSLAGTGFLFYRQLQFCHYCKSEKIAIDGDAIYGYTVTASLNDI